MYRRLLVPLDGSDLAESVLPMVEGLSSASGAEVVLLHVLERGAPSSVHGHPHLCAADQASVYLEQVAERLRREGIQVEYHAHDAPEGDVARSIADHAQEIGADLIALCTHGGGGVREFFFGSIAQRVLRRGTQPVLLVRPRDGEPAPLPAPGVILVPLDATAAAEKALAPAQEMASLLGSHLHLVMVVATQETIRGERVPAATLLPSATRSALELERQDAAGYLEKLANGLRVRGMAVTTEVRRGDTTSALVDEAGEPGVALVVVATHGRAGLQATWAGSVTAGLLGRVRAPMLLLRTIDQ